MTEGRKYDEGKQRWSLLPLAATRAVVRVLEFGARKYGVGNWRHVDGLRDRYYNAAMRHLTDWWGGETEDPETGESHLAHAICCLTFLLDVEEEGGRPDKAGITQRVGAVVDPRLCGAAFVQLGTTHRCGRLKAHADGHALAPTENEDRILQEERG